MALVMDPMYLVNLVLCVVILFLGWMGYKKSKKAVPLYVGIGFALFGVSHLATILGMKESLETVLIVVRTLGYLVVAFALYRLWKG